MSIRNFNNTTALGTLSGALASSATSVGVTGFTGTPTVPFTATIDRNTASEEIVLVTAVASGTLTVTRGYDGTAAIAHSAGATIEHTAGAIEYTEANQHVNATSNVHGTTGNLVGAEGAQTIFDKTLVSPVAQADATAGDALVAYDPTGSRNLFRGTNSAGTDVIVVDHAGNLSAQNVSAAGALTAGGAATFNAGLTANAGLTVPAGQTGSIDAVSASTLSVTNAATVGWVVMPSVAAPTVPTGKYALHMNSHAPTLNDSSGFYGTLPAYRSVSTGSFPTSLVDGETTYRGDLLCAYRYNGTTWQQVGTANSTSSNRTGINTANIPEGYRFHETDTGLDYIYTLSAWVQVATGGTAVTVTPAGGWQQYRDANSGQSLQYLQATKLGSLVSVSGVLSNTLAYSSPATAATLPTGYRPGRPLMGLAIAPSMTLRVDIAVDGTITMNPFGTVAANSYHGVNFTFNINNG